MEFQINRQTIEAERLAGKDRAQLLVRAETLVSGAGREAVDILLADANVSLGAVDVQTDRLVVDGVVRCQATYRLGSEMSARALNAQTSLNHVFDMKGIARGMIGRAAVEVDEVRARYENGHMLFDISLTVNARVTELVPCDVITSVDGEHAIQTRYEEIMSMKLSAENTVTALLSDSVSLPAALDARTSLMEWAAVSDLDVRKDLGGVRVTGNVALESLISSGVTSRPIALVRYTLPLNQLVELPEWLSDHAHASAAVRSVSTNVEQAAGGEDSTLRMEAEIDVHVSAVGMDRVSALTDAYSAGDKEIKPEMQSYEVCTGYQNYCVNEPFRGTILLPEGAGAVGSVCAIRARANVGEVAQDGGVTTINGVVDAQVLYMSGSGDKLMHQSAFLPFEVSLASALNEDAWVSVTVQSAEGNALMSDRVELKCMLQISASAWERGNIEVVSELVETDSSDTFKGILIVWPQTGDDIWDLAKRYRMPEEKVIASNGGKARVDPGKAIVIRK